RGSAVRILVEAHVGILQVEIASPQNEEVLRLFPVSAHSGSVASRDGLRARRPPWNRSDPVLEAEGPAREARRAAGRPMPLELSAKGKRARPQSILLAGKARVSRRR